MFVCMHEIVYLTPHCCVCTDMIKSSLYNSKLIHDLAVCMAPDLQSYIHTYTGT